MKVLLVEDERNAAEKLNKILLRIDSQIEVLGICDSVSGTVAWLQENASPDLMFLDIQLTDGISFEIFKRVKITCPIIFVTAFDEFAIQAFQVNSVDYILKPYSIEEVAKGIEKYKNYHSPSTIKFNEQLYAELSKVFTPNYKTRFYTKLNNSVFSVKIQDLQYIKYEDKSTVLVDTKNRKFIIDYSLDALEELLDPTMFFRINRQFIVSFKSIIKMDVSAKNRIGVKLVDLEHKEFVSRAKTKEFKEWLDQ